MSDVNGGNNMMRFILPAWGKKCAVVDAPESTILRTIFSCVLAMLTLVGFFYAKGYLRELRCDKKEAYWKKKYWRKSNVKPDTKNNKKKTRKSD